VGESNGEQKILTMPADHEPDRIEPGQPEHMIVKLEAILEPALAARCTMSNRDMEELIDSLDTLGQRDPLQLVRRGDMFEIIDGHRRFLAARELNARYAHKGELRWTCLRAEVYPENEPNLLAARLHANIIREQLNPGEEAIFMRQAMEQMGLDLAALCRLFHRSESYINSRFALVYGAPEILQAVLDGKINMSSAHQLNRIDNEKSRAHYLDCAMKTNPPGHVVEGWVREYRKMQPYLEQATMPAIEPQPQPEPQPVGRACVLCGGHLDQENLIEVTFHRWEWENIYKQLTGGK
jgi:ParB/RepB/Spo0J family partition protein